LRWSLAGVASVAGRVLLCRNRKHGYCYLPGGHVEFGEPAAVALAREFEEESGVAVRVGEFCFAHEQVFRQRGKLKHEVSLVFHVELPGGYAGDIPEPIPSLEDHIEFIWQPLADLGEVEVLPHHHAAWLLGGGGAWIEQQP
jgi:8-oxo-dGTP diphosphatase